MRSLNGDRLQELLLNATAETLYMVLLAALFTIALGLPVGVLLFLTRKDGILPNRSVSFLLNVLVNTGRALPFVVLLIALIPFTRLLVGTTLGSTAAIVPITLGAFPFFARIVENALDEVDRGRIEAVMSMGGNLWHIVSRVLLPEALPALVAGITLTIVMLIGFSAMAGVVGGGGLGDLAIRYGYQRFDNQVMAATIVLLLVMVQLIQKLGDRLVRSLAYRR
ncbi:ABC transporter permease [Pantoea alhagi]|uniref:methionine ABC transporter permease n=1 Tax=Pantoea alhagi TaxID=1891675 RepID=UPI00202B3729|nr:methionine ABC transporter permease [Pantoea alhagi]URQ59182.1 ABC transporter permease [Pantoea alhagi]